MNDEARAEWVKDRCSNALLGQRGIWGVGIEKMADGRFCVAIHVDSRGSDISLPEEIDGVPVLIINSGPIVAYGGRRR